MKIVMLGTGNAKAIECYNTCFAIDDHGRYLLVDGGGGNGLFKQLNNADIDYDKIDDIFLTHKHLDHLTGVMWLIRMFCQNMKSDSTKRIYGHHEVINILKMMACMLLNEKEVQHIGKGLKIIEVEDGECLEIIGHDFTFFDIRSSKAKQFGFMLRLENDEKLVCLGDEPYQPHLKSYADNAKYLLHEAFCLYSEKELFDPYGKHHSTVRDACLLANELNVKSLILYHTEDKNIKRRKELYSMEGQQYFSGNLLIPDDLEIIEI